MKKSINFLAIFLFALTNASFASDHKPLINHSSYQSNDLNTPLVIAIFNGDIMTITKIIEYGADVNEKSNGLSPLMYAARYNKVEIIKILISSGAVINDKDSHGFTALKYAELSNAKEASALLKRNK